MTKFLGPLALCLATASALLVADLAAGRQDPLMQELVVSGAPSTAGALYPGGKADLALVVRNPNGVPVGIASFALRGAITSDDELLCPGAANVKFAAGTGRVRIIGARTTGRIVLREALSMSPDAPQGCAGRTFTIPLVHGTATRLDRGPNRGHASSGK